MWGEKVRRKENKALLKVYKIYFKKKVEGKQDVNIFVLRFEKRIRYQ